MLFELQQRLLRIHHGVFQDDANVLPWITPVVASLLLEHAVEMRPQSIRYKEGRPLDRHRNALEYATLNPRATAWFGFSLSLGCWWLHSWVLEEDGTVIDSGPPTAPAIYAGLLWGLELYTAISKRPVALLRSDATPPMLPPVPARSIFSITTRCKMLEGKIHRDVFTSH